MQACLRLTQLVVEYLLVLVAGRTLHKYTGMGREVLENVFRLHLSPSQIHGSFVHAAASARESSYQFLLSALLSQYHILHKLRSRTSATTAVAVTSRDVNRRVVLLQEMVIDL